MMQGPQAPATGDHTILFTVTTRAVALNPDHLPISVFVAPRLTGGRSLRAFPDWLNWTRNLQRHGLELEMATGTRTMVVPIDTGPLRRDLWKELFTRRTLVDPHEFDDYSGRKVVTYSVNDSLSVLKAIYQDASVSLALPDPPDLRDPEQDDRRPDPGNRDHLRVLIDGLQVHWRGHPTVPRRPVTGIRDGRRVDHEGLTVFANPPTAAQMRGVAAPFAVFHHMPSPPERDELAVDPATLFDFHKALSALNSYPRLLRALGLVFDIDLPRDFVDERPFPQVSLLWVRSAAMRTAWSVPPTIRGLRTAVVHASLDPSHRVFATAPRALEKGSTAPLLFGLLDLNGGFGFAQLDVDGGMHKAIMMAETVHPPGDHNALPDAGPEPAPNPEVFDSDATLPALRSGGMTLYADRAGLATLDALKASKKFNEAVATGTAATLFADDLVRGYRLDVWDSLTASWHSLHRRSAQYRVGDLELDTGPTDEEGFVELAVTQPAPGAKPASDDLYVHEALARWRGWSLSAPLPFRHLSRYPAAEDALPDLKPGDPPDMFDEDEPVTPFQVTSPYKVVKGSLPALRFGARYRMRARVVDIAGNSLDHDDGFAELLSPFLALPRDPEGFAYLRFEPVAAPLVIIRDSAVVTRPGSAVHRIVVRTSNSGPELDSAPADTSLADRHIVPPRTSVELGEQMGMFDAPFGKLRGDAATRILIAERDAGEFATETIPVAGGTPQAYPVEPGDAIDTLPYLPDLLARGAAIRDLPGTASGVVGRAHPGAGPAATLAYVPLSDPNPRPGSATIVGFGGPDWVDRAGFRLSLAEPAAGQVDVAPRWDPAARVLTVYLAKGRMTTVPLTTWVGPHDLKLLGVWQWLREYVDRIVGDPKHQRLRPGSDADRVDHVLQRAVEGGHWMFTPPTLLTLVHAVQQPIGRPAFAALNVVNALPSTLGGLQTGPARGALDPGELAPITAWRRFGATDTLLLGALQVHGATTSRIDFAAEWDDPVDQPPATEADPPTVPGTEHRTGMADVLLLKTLRNNYLPAGGQGGRLAGYYDPDHDQIAFVQSGDESRPEHGRPTSFREAAPRHHIGDTRHHVVTYTPTATSRFQEYFPSGLDFTRTGLPVVVDVPASARPLAPDVVSVVPTFGWQRQVDTNLKRSVRFGGGLRVYLNRPWYSSGVGELLGVALFKPKLGPPSDVARVKLKPYITQWGMDPIWDTAPLTGFPDLEWFPDAVDSDSGVSLEEDAARNEEGKPGRVDVVGFKPEFDPARSLWFADLTVNLPNDTYMPFVRLALVRYQPHALPDALISRVVLADFMQLTPDRTATVTADPHHPRTLRVAVSGVAPRGPRAAVQGDVEASPTRPTQVSVRVQRRDPVVRSDLAWHDVDSSVATVAVLADGTAPGSPDIELWRGTVMFAERPISGGFRLLVEEREFISADFVELDGRTSRPPSRVIYAETFAVDDVLTGD